MAGSTFVSNSGFSVSKSVLEGTCEYSEAAVDTKEIIRLNQWLQSRVNLDEHAEGIAIRFSEPTAEDLLHQGFGEEIIDLTLQSSWWSDMVTDIVETPDFAEPDESAEQVLEYARDLVVEYIAKRLNP
jgi:hypothetical protein